MLQPCWHLPECYCFTCHQNHIYEGLIVENALKFRGDFPCCVDHLEFMYSEQLLCQKHPDDYSEKGYCEGCEQNNLKEKIMEVH